MREIRQLSHIIKRERTATDGATKGTMTGIIKKIDQTAQSAVVTLQPYGVDTGYIPILTPWAGPGWGLFCPPIVGSFVTVHFEGGDIDSGQIVARATNDTQPPLATPPGEFWLVHSTGSSIKLTNDGHISISVTGDDTLLMGNASTLKKLVTDVFVQLFNTHTHPNLGVPPSQKMNDTHLTTEIRGS